MTSGQHGQSEFSTTAAGSRPGAASRAARAVRRGTVLILVLGVLALLAVITAVYVSVGQADRRTGETVKRTKAVDDTAERIAQHISGVVGNDAVSTTIDSVASNRFNRPPQVFLRREAMDYPFTDWSRESMLALPRTQVFQIGARRFDPSGSFSAPWPTTGVPQPDPRLASDPFLAATEPSWLSPDGSDDLTTNPDRLDEYLNFRDWAHISNIAPDGRYVNLFNLRPQAAGFDATPAQMSRIAVGGANLGSSRPLTFLDEPTPTRAPQPRTNPNFDTAPTGVWQNRPAYFSNYQRFAFRPMDISDGLDWTDHEYIRYQWADTDGDGFADARWQELRDATDPNNVLDLLPGGEYRWFVAARVIDLSGLVNVNTAGDFLSPGVSGLPTGMTPGEVDLRRLLTLSDLSDPSNDFASVGYTALRSPSVPASQDPMNSLAVFSDGTNASQSRAAAAGSGAMAALRRSLFGGVTPEAQFDLSADPINPFTGAQATPPFDWRRGAFGNLRWEVSGTGTAPPIDAFARFMAYNEAAAAFQRGEFARAGSRGYFGISDLSELLTYRGANDDTVLSRLEQATAGRISPADPAASSAPSAADGTSVALRLDPLRSTRSAAWERGGRAEPDATGPLSGGINQGALAQSAMDVRQRLTTLSGHRPIRAGALPPVTQSATAPALNASEDLKADIASAVVGVQTGETVVDRASALRTIVKGYLDGLSPFSGESAAWRPSGATPWPKATLSYGYDGPELSFHLAAQLAVNLVDAYDDDAAPALFGGSSTPALTTSDNFPTVVTVVTDQRFVESASGAPTSGTTLESQIGTAVQSRLHPWAASGDGMRFPPQILADSTFAEQRDGTMRTRLRPATGTPAAAPVYSPAFNVYGIEAFPVVTQAVSMYAYGDTPGGSPDDTFTDSNGNTFIYPTINGTVAYTNEDLLLHAVAFELHNPFDVPVDLSSATDLPYLYYIQFGGKAYRVAEVELDADGSPSAVTEITLGPGQTRWFYFAGDLTVYESRFATFAGSPTTDSIRELIARQLGLDPAIPEEAPICLQPFDPLTGAALDPASLPADLVTAPGLDPQESTVVRLWRAIRVDPSSSDESINRPENDMLVDRLRDPGTAAVGLGVLARRLDDSSIAVGRDSGQEPDPGDEDLGFTFLVVNAMRRPDEPTTPRPLGALPAFMLEAKPGTSLVSLNIAENSDVPGATGVEIDALDRLWFFPSPGFEGLAASTPATFRDRVVGDGVTPAITGLSRTRFLTEPTSRTTDPIGANAASVAWAGVRARIYLENQRTRSAVLNRVENNDLQPVPGVVRLTDVLAQLAVGATFDPWRGVAPLYGAEIPTSGTLPGGIVTNAFVSGGIPNSAEAPADDLRWTTAGEALAFALNYAEDRAATSDGVPNPRFNIGVASTVAGVSLPPKLERGMLVLDGWTPFDNNNTPATPEYTPPTGSGAQDRVRGLGIPAALAVLDNFRALGRYQLRSVVGNEYQLSRTPLGGADQAAPGTININTAPLAVLRTLPLLSPVQAADFTVGSGPPAWWGGASSMSGSDLTNPLGVTTRSSDIAARLVAYRDKTWQQRSRTPTTGSVSIFSYGEANSGTTVADLDAPTLWSGRFASPVLNPGGTVPDVAVREGPGFRSVGELMMLVNRDPAVVDPNAIDILGRDTSTGTAAGTPRAIGALVQTSGGRDVAVGGGGQFYRPAGSAVGPRELADGIANDAEEKLAILGALGNTVSVSSDFYACWFVMQGYKREVVEGLRTTDPLLPSVQRRYLMVLDRSNVQRVGDRPRVVLFKELPM